MKIIKQLNADDWAKCYRSCTNPDAHWDWGFGDDGRLYGKGFIFGFANLFDWAIYENMPFGISLKEMKRIVNAFGDLVMFI